MKKSTKIKSLVAAAAVACFSFAGLVATPTYAEINCPDDFSYDNRTRTCTPDGDNVNLWGIVNTIINVILAIVGVIAVVMIIIGGIQYSTSAGDPGKVKKAKDTILYGVIGLVIALLAFAIVNFVLTSIFDGSGSAPATGSYTTKLACETGLPSGQSCVQAQDGNWARQ